ncbi:Dopey, N-terminal-domain-containing protein [Multifurca ochricompacta]|uniref:Dopey, N-terminal-domain-containing protein n=1 Tax=Multifurca ochricompacta TaxID=376703 RepID=A0AAD4QRI3_9AGAM|nr:Dopey, N-terminal-domain-containing protein [Multifurca ochricompacta]
MCTTYPLDARSNIALAQQAYASDPKYKKYAQQVDRCLNSFDNVHEWADFIAFLKQLLKTLQAYMQFKEIPRKIIVAKRLSQCLNPALPTGVHQRALDVYAHILGVIGLDGLRRDLFLWASGLFPFFEYSATSVKHTLLNIYDVYFLPLKSSLRPAMKSFILALLPGLEEETGEFFEQVLSLLDRLSASVSLTFFLENVWLIILTVPPARGTALNLVSRRLPRLVTKNDFATIFGHDVGLMIRAFASALEDDNLLVRRYALDLILQVLRLDGVAILKASHEDRIIIMRAATGVVMRRDLSLNRRLYTWLLGPDENAEQQIAYLRSHSLELLKTTLHTEMFSPSTEYPESRPFKIFISLLDKWEIGGTLTEAIILDAFKALKPLIESKPASGEDIVMTASTLYEAVEPHIVWKQLTTAVLNELTGDGSQSEVVRLTHFILKTIHVRDEEIQVVHLPIVFSALCEALKVQMARRTTRGPVPVVSEALWLLHALRDEIPPPSLLQLSVDSKNDSLLNARGPLELAQMFYGLTIQLPSNKTRVVPHIPFASAFEDIVSFSAICATAVITSVDHRKIFRDLLVQSLSLLNKLVTSIDLERERCIVDWNPSDWVHHLVTALETEDTTFLLVDQVITLLVALQNAPGLQPAFSISQRHVIFKLLRMLFNYLRPNYAMYHARAASLLWIVEKSSSQRHVESIIAETLMSPNAVEKEASYHAFGALWRLTEDSSLPGFSLKVPLMIILDTLKNDDPNLRRIGETWMRCNLRSYLRALDPILHDLLDPAVKRVISITEINGRQLQGFSYERPFDQTYVNHLLETLLSVVKFGGQGFGKTARASLVRKSYHAELVERIRSAGLTNPDVTYQDVLLDVLTRFLQSECKIKRVDFMAPTNVFTQSTTIDLLQAVVARGEVDPPSLQNVQAAVIGKLYFSIHTQRLELQNKLLYLLHSVISAMTASQDPRALRPTNAVASGTLGEVQAHDRPEDPHSPSLNPLLVQTLVDGISLPSNNPVLQHWLDFILMAVPQFHHTLQALVSPLGDCICKNLRIRLDDIRRALRDGHDHYDFQSNTTDAELIMLLNALERMVLLSLSTTETSQAEDDDVPVEKPLGAESGGLLGIVTSVFSSESAPNNLEEQLTVRSPGYRALNESVRVLYAIWDTTAQTKQHTSPSKHEMLSLICAKTRIRCRRVFEHLFRLQSAEVFESIVDCWNTERSTMPLSIMPPFELVDALAASAHNVVHMICESISCRVNGLSDRNRRQVINPNLSDGILFRFLENYLDQLEGPLAVQVWHRFLQLAKDITTNIRDFRPQVFPVLRCVSTLADKITQTTALEDKRIRKDLQDTYGKLLDAVVMSVNRSTDTNYWARRSNKDSLILNGRDSPIPRVPSDIRLDEKTSRPSSPSPEVDQADQIVQYIGDTALPRLRKFLVDNDRVLTVCTNIMYYVVSPALKIKSRPLDFDPTITTILREMTRVSVAIKAWRGAISDLVNDTRFFTCSLEAGMDFRSIIHAWVDTDKSVFTEFLTGKVTPAPSTNIFTNRETENQLRSMNIRRMSYILLCGEKNQFLTSLPTIQEKLVDTMKNSSAPVVQSEAYLCVRILLCRLSRHNLDSFWPVILSEMYRLLEHSMIEAPPDGSEALPLILSVCKFIDLLLVLQTEEFQMHQWIFITDTIDAVYRPDEVAPESMLDQLSEIAGGLPPSQQENAQNSLTVGLDFLSTPALNPRMLRRPMLNHLRQIDSIRDLVPFFSSVSVASYESVYSSGGNIDWDEVERGLLSDMFEPR